MFGRGVNEMFLLPLVIAVLIGVIPVKGKRGNLVKIAAIVVLVGLAEWLSI